jgi:hypothetical protein
MALPEGASGRYLEPLEMLRLGPSASNRQPWRVVKEQGRDIFHLYLRRSKGHDKLIKAVERQRIDMGIAMSHFELTVRELGLGEQWEEMAPSLSPVRCKNPSGWGRESSGDGMTRGQGSRMTLAWPPYVRPILADALGAHCGSKAAGH